MSLSHRNNLRLIARNEGKIKSYESCTDVRAWSHDVTVRNKYLREWMKADMPVCMIPVKRLLSCLKTMTYKSRSRATPHCRPDCKSKVILESICASCEAVKKCLKQGKCMEKYFVEEEFETSHWPCDRCLEALKRIKMLWKIIINKLFGITMPNNETLVTNNEPTNNIRAIAKVWQAELLQQAIFVKTIITPAISTASNVFGCENLIDDRPKQSRRTLKICDDNKEKKHIPNSRIHITSSKSSELNVKSKRLCKKVSKCTFVGTKMVDVGCNICIEDDRIKDIKNTNRNIQLLQEKCSNQRVEMEKLRKEKDSLKKQLEKVYKTSPWKASFYVPDGKDPDHQVVTIIPKPFEGNVEENYPVKNIDSEMIITMKNCKNENFKHVSLLQVLHKTNVPIDENKPQHGHCSKKEDPIEILNKVQNTFGAIVKREMGIVNEKRHRPSKTEVDASFHHNNSNKTAPSTCTLSTQLSSEPDFISTKD